jgi:hypothetical protein
VVSDAVGLQTDGFVHQRLSAGPLFGPLVHADGDVELFEPPLAIPRLHERFGQLTMERRVLRIVGDHTLQLGDAERRRRFAVRLVQVDGDRRRRRWRLRLGHIEIDEDLLRLGLSHVEIERDLIRLGLGHVEIERDLVRHGRRLRLGHVEVEGDVVVRRCQIEIQVGHVGCRGLRLLLGHVESTKVDLRNLDRVRRPGLHLGLCRRFDLEIDIEVRSFRLRGRFGRGLGLTDIQIDLEIRGRLLLYVDITDDRIDVGQVAREVLGGPAGDRQPVDRAAPVVLLDQGRFVLRERRRLDLERRDILGGHRVVFDQRLGLYCGNLVVGQRRRLDLQRRSGSRLVVVVVGERGGFDLDRRGVRRRGLGNHFVGDRLNGGLILHGRRRLFLDIRRVEIDEHQIAALGLLGGRAAGGGGIVELRIDGLHPIDGGPRLPHVRPVHLRVELIELFPRLVRPGSLLQLLGKQEPDLLVVRREIGELLQRTERLLDLARVLHPLRVLEQVALRLGDEAALGHELGKFEIDRCPARRGTQDLVAERDRVVREPALRIPVRGTLPHLDRGTHVADLLVQIAGLVEEAEFVVEIGGPVELVDDLDVQIECALPLLLELELSGLVLRLFDVQGEPLPADGEQVSEADRNPTLDEKM